MSIVDNTESASNEQLAEYLLVAKNLTAGGIAGAVSRTIVSPLERTKILFQVQIDGGNVYGKGKQFHGILPTLVRIGREEGIGGYFKGNLTNVVRIVPYSAVQFATYEFLKKIFTKINKGQDLSTRQRLIAGAGAGICSVISTYPLDLVRTHLSLPNAKESSILSCISRVYRNEGGICGLYSGILPTILGIAPYVALNFTIYETLRSYAVYYAERQDPPILLKLGCGGVAGAMAQTITYPLDVLRRRMQVSRQLGLNYKSNLHAVQTIYRTEGILAFYKGIVPNFLKVVPSIAVSFVTFEFVRNTIMS